MPPLVVAAGVIALFYGGFKVLKAAGRKAQADLDAVRKGEPIEAGTLKKDPITGDYRVEK